MAMNGSPVCAVPLVDLRYPEVPLLRAVDPCEPHLIALDCDKHNEVVRRVRLDQLDRRGALLKRTCRTGL